MALQGALLLLSANTAAASDGHGCTDNKACSLNGICTASRCKCDPGWTGPRCNLLDFAPVIYPRQIPFHSSPGGFRCLGREVCG